MIKKLECTKKILAILGIIYLGIIGSVNFLGYLITSSGLMPIIANETYQLWIDFMESHVGLIGFMFVMSFVIPTIVCLCYVLICSDDKVARRIINLPLLFSLFGVIGWVLSFILESSCLIILKIQTGSHIASIVVSSLLNILQVCLFVSTFAFLCLDAINRKIVLPRIFPDGKLTEYEGAIKLKSKTLITFFYLSVSIFPIFFLTSTLYSLSLQNNFSVPNGFYGVLGFICILGIIIVINFSNYFSIPLKKMKNATNIIKSEKYDEKVDVVSCDDFGELADNFNDMAFALDEKSKKISAIQDSMIKGMAVMVESRDNSTGGHINRTSDCVKVFISKLRNYPGYEYFSDSFCKAMIKAAPMHDLGKIAVDDAILRKPGRFTDEEYEIMKKHSAEGARIVEHVVREVQDEEFKRIAINVAHYHHEKWDGSGYPQKISGEQIPVEARIMALADVFDALVSKRCYKDSMSYDQAFQIIQNSLGTHFNPEIGAVFVECRKELEALYNGYEEGRK